MGENRQRWPICIRYEHQGGIGMIQIKKDIVGSYLKISFSGKLIYGQTTSANDMLKQIPRDHEGYILDLNDVEKIDSTGFGMLVNFASEFKNTRFAIVVNNELTLRLLKIAKFDLIFLIVTNEADAITAIKNNEAPPLKLDEY